MTTSTKGRTLNTLRRYFGASGSPDAVVISRGQALSDRELRRIRGFGKQSVLWLRAQTVDAQIPATFIDALAGSAIDKLVAGGWVAEANHVAELASARSAVLPPGTVCSCLEETGSLKIELFGRCQRCGAFMLADDAVTRDWWQKETQ